MWQASTVPFETASIACRPGTISPAEKTWISNGGIADHYVVFARTGEAPGARVLSAFVVDADAPGLAIVERIDVVAPHPLAFYAAHVANALRPKLRHAAFIGSFGWSSKAPEQVAGLLPNLKVELLPPVLSRGQPGAETCARLDDLAAAIADRHAKL